MELMAGGPSGGRLGKSRAVAEPRALLIFRDPPLLGIRDLIRTSEVSV